MSDGNKPMTGEAPPEFVDAVAKAMQEAWDDWTADTGEIPTAFTIAGPPTTKVYADMTYGNFAKAVADRLAHREPYDGNGLNGV